jgi:hypothetical protein
LTNTVTSLPWHRRNGTKVKTRISGISSRGYPSQVKWYFAD